MDDNTNQSRALDIKLPVIIPIIIGASLVIASSIGAYAFYRVRTLDVISVTGSTKQAITSDTVRWVAQFSRTVKESNVKAGYDQMEKDLANVRSFYLSNGLTEKDMVISPVFMDPIYDYNNSGQNKEKEYQLRQTVEVLSHDVERITNISKNSQALIQKNVLFSTQFLEYSYSKLADLRVTLLTAAMKDAKARAEKLVQDSGRSVGALQSAASGVVQVMSAGSNDVSDYGTYDTSKIEKEVMVTVRASFAVE